MATLPQSSKKEELAVPRKIKRIRRKRAKVAVVAKMPRHSPSRSGWKRDRGKLKRPRKRKKRRLSSSRTQTILVQINLATWN